jgi:hypothetical protein
MALAQVVYNLSTDSVFASKMRSDPEVALAERGWWLSKEERAFLLTILRREVREISEIVTLAKTINSPWVH